VNSLQQAKFVAAIKPAAIIDDASATAEAIDTRGWDYATIIVQLGATDIGMTALKVQNSATSGGSYVDITGATFDDGAGMGGAVLALPSATDDGQTCVFQIDMRNKNPFLKVVATFGNGSAGGFVAAVCVLSRGKISPVLSAEAADGDVCRVV
jgi:hypothetical protein